VYGITAATSETTRFQGQEWLFGEPVSCGFAEDANPYPSANEGITVSQAFQEVLKNHGGHPHRRHVAPAIQSITLQSQLSLTLPLKFFLLLVCRLNGERVLSHLLSFI